MVSVTQRSKVYRPITAQDGVEGKECAVCGEWKPRTEYTAGHYDGLDHRCKPCQARLRAERTATKYEAEIPPERAPVLAQPRAVVLDGVSFQVGFHGDAEYVPLGALVGFSRYSTDEALVRAVKSDELLGAVTTILQVLNPRDKKTYQVWCLPWSHFSAFCLKFGGPETLPQQQRAQQVIEAAFGRTAQSNRDAVARGAPAPTATPGALEETMGVLVMLLRASLREEMRTVIEEAMGVVPQQTTEIAETLRGATVITTEREVVRLDEWVANGYCYLFVNDTDGEMAIGETGKTPEQRIKEDGYNGQKGARQPWRVAHMMQVDDRKAMQTLMQRYAQRMGVPSVRGDVYALDARYVADFRRLPRKVRLDSVRRIVEQGALFVPPLFGGIA